MKRPATILGVGVAAWLLMVIALYPEHREGYSRLAVMADASVFAMPMLALTVAAALAAIGRQLLRDLLRSPWRAAIFAGWFIDLCATVLLAIVGIMESQSTGGGSIGTGAMIYGWGALAGFGVSIQVAFATVVVGYAIKGAGWLAGYVFGRHGGAGRQ